MPESDSERAIDEKIQSWRQSYDLAWVQMGLIISMVVNAIEIMLLIYAVLSLNDFSDRLEKFEARAKVLEDFIIRKGDDAKPKPN